VRKIARSERMYMTLDYTGTGRSPCEAKGCCLRLDTTTDW